ncbi:hypothetical protein [uncultured Serinicoccus sp.]|uniref:hypothetical protein n=1 Tax=uncultured Serinicoccus sp. TaxID=735514 RepID=UPI00260EEE1C|nr:hypothetical protein [uncultured Serinicoccus sp.]
MAEWWVAVLTLVVGAVVGYGGHWAQAKVATRDNQDTIAEARRATAHDHMRWSMDQLVSEDPESRGLGVAQLETLAASPDLTDFDVRLIRAALASALEPIINEWDTRDQEDPAEESP